MDPPRLGHLTELPPPLRWPLASWFSEDRTSVWVLGDGLAACPGCSTLRAVFQVTRQAGRVEARCIGCATTTLSDLQAALHNVPDAEGTER